MGQTVGMHQNPVSYQPCSGGTLLLLRGAGTEWQKDFKEYSFWYLDLLLISQEYWAVFGVCQHLRVIFAEGNVVLCIDCNLRGQYGGVHSVSTWLGEAQLPWGLPGQLGESTASPQRRSQQQPDLCALTRPVHKSLSLHRYTGNLEQYLDEDAQQGAHILTMLQLVFRLPHLPAGIENFVVILED